MTEMMIYLSNDLITLYLISSQEFKSVSIITTPSLGRTSLSKMYCQFLQLFISESFPWHSNEFVYHCKINNLRKLNFSWLYLNKNLVLAVSKNPPCLCSYLLPNNPERSSLQTLFVSAGVRDVHQECLEVMDLWTVFDNVNSEILFLMNMMWSVTVSLRCRQKRIYPRV